MAIEAAKNGGAATIANNVLINARSPARPSLNLAPLFAGRGRNSRQRVGAKRRPMINSAGISGEGQGAVSSRIYRTRMEQPLTQPPPPEGRREGPVSDPPG